MALEYWVEFKVFEEISKEFIAGARTDTVQSIEEVLSLAGNLWSPFDEANGEDHPITTSLNIVVRNGDIAKKINYSSEILPLHLETDFEEQQAIDYLKKIAEQL